MTDFHGVFPYLISPLDAGGRVKAAVPPQRPLTAEERRIVAAELAAVPAMDQPIPA